MKPVYKTVLFVSIAIAVVIYGLFFSKLSETAMVRWSYFWFPGVVYGIAGLMFGDKGAKRPVMAALAGVFVLVIFFEGIFPSL